MNHYCEFKKEKNILSTTQSVNKKISLSIKIEGNKYKYPNKLD